MQVRSIHEVEVRRLLVPNPGDGYHVVIDGLVPEDDALVSVTNHTGSRIAVEELALS